MTFQIQLYVFPTLFERFVVWLRIWLFAISPRDQPPGSGTTTPDAFAFSKTSALLAFKFPSNPIILNPNEYASYRSTFHPCDWKLV